MTHFYNEYDQDCYNCDYCGNEIRPNEVYNKHGIIPKIKPKFWNNDEHYHKECLE